jgi:hypothetical protein
MIVERLDNNNSIAGSNAGLPRKIWTENRTLRRCNRLLDEVEKYEKQKR